MLPDGTLGEPLEGAIEIAASCGLPDGLPSIARLLSDAVKGALPGIPTPLQVSTVYMASAHERWHPAVSDSPASGMQQASSRVLWMLVTWIHHVHEANAPAWRLKAPWLHGHEYVHSLQKR